MPSPEKTDKNELGEINTFAKWIAKKPNVNSANKQ